MRKANLIQTGIWLDADFIAIPVDAKLVYLLLITQPDISHVGIVTLAPTRWARQAGLTQKRFTAALRALVDARFIVCDQETDEVLVRSWVKHNLAGSKLETAGKAHFKLVGSPLLRWMLQTEHPDLFGDAPPDTLSDTPSYPPPSERGEGEGDRGKGVSSSSVDRRTRATVDAIWAEYAARHPTAAYTSERRERLNRWLDTYPAETLTQAIIGNHLDPHCNGDNPRGQQYHSFELIFRDSEHIERYAAIAHHGPPKPRLNGADATLQLAHDTLTIERTSHAAR